MSNKKMNKRIHKIEKQVKKLRRSLEELRCEECEETLPDPDYSPTESDTTKHDALDNCEVLDAESSKKVWCNLPECLGLIRHREHSNNDGDAFRAIREAAAEDAYPSRT